MKRYAVLLLVSLTLTAAEPIRLHPDNPHYFTLARKAVNECGQHNQTTTRPPVRWREIAAAPKVLIIDEMGYLPTEDRGATIFFQRIRARYEPGSSILTSNKSYGDWGIRRGR